MTIPQPFIYSAKHIHACACSVASTVRRKGQLFPRVSGPLRVMLLIAVFQLAACDVRTTKSPEDFPALHTVASVDSGIHAGGVSLVSFGGKNCGPCKKMRGILHDLKMEKPELRIVLVYWEDAPEAFEHYRIGAIPAQIVFGSDGSEQKRHQGIWSKDDIQQAIASVR